MMTSTVYELFHVLCFGHASHTMDVQAYLTFCVQNRDQEASDLTLGYLYKLLVV